MVQVTPYDQVFPFSPSCKTYKHYKIKQFFFFDFQKKVIRTRISEWRNAFIAEKLAFCLFFKVFFVDLNI